VHLDSVVVYTGRGAARLARNADSPSGFTSITKRLPIEFDGRRLEEAIRQVLGPGADEEVVRRMARRP